MTAVHSDAHCRVAGLRVPVLGPEWWWGGCVLFEKCIVDASISHMGSDRDFGLLLLCAGMNIAISL